MTPAPAAEGTPLLLCAGESETELRREFAAAFPGGVIEPVHPQLFAVRLGGPSSVPPPLLVFARQFLPAARPVAAESIRDWAETLVAAVAGVLPDDQPWTMHVEPHYGARPAHRIGARAWHSATRGRAVPAVSEAAGPVVDAAAGRQRCRLIHEAVVEALRKKRRHLLRRLRPLPVPFTPGDSLVQLLLTAPGRGFLSVAAAPVPERWQRWISPFPKGEVAPASDQSAPSRAFAKLAEAGLRLGRPIAVGETCVDLGASPGSWTWLARQQGARVIAVDRSPLREDLARDPQVEFVAGDAFRYQPARPVDWLLCDVIAAPERSAALLLEWVRRRWCRRFVVSLKLGDDPADAVLAGLKAELPLLAPDVRILRLCANKKEVCAFGTVGGEEKA